MKYVSIDLETTGLNPKKDKILSVGMVIEDTEKNTPIDELPSLHLYIVRDKIEGSVTAIDLNRDIIKSISDFNIFGIKKDGVKYILPKNIYTEIDNFLLSNSLNGRINVAGKNPNFDTSFLRKIKNGKNLLFRTRVLDTANI